MSDEVSAVLTRQLAGQTALLQEVVQQVVTPFVKLGTTVLEQRKKRLELAKQMPESMNTPERQVLRRFCDFAQTAIYEVMHKIYNRKNIADFGRSYTKVEFEFEGQKNFVLLRTHDEEDRDTQQDPFIRQEFDEHWLLNTEDTDVNSGQSLWELLVDAGPNRVHEPSVNRGLSRTVRRCPHVFLELSINAPHATTVCIQRFRDRIGWVERRVVLDATIMANKQAFWDRVLPEYKSLVLEAF